MHRRYSLPRIPADHGPAFPLYIPTFRYLTAKRVKNVIYNNYFGYPILNAMSVG